MTTNKTNNLIGGSILAVIVLIVLWTILFNSHSEGFQAVHNASTGSHILAAIFYLAFGYVVWRTFARQKKGIPNPSYTTLIWFLLFAAGTIALWGGF